MFPFYIPKNAFEITAKIKKPVDIIGVEAYEFSMTLNTQYPSPISYDRHLYELAINKSEVILEPLFNRTYDFYSNKYQLHIMYDWIESIKLNINWDKIPKDTPIQLNGDIIRHFSHYKNKKVFYYDSGRTSFTTTRVNSVDEADVSIALYRNKKLVPVNNGIIIS